MITRGQARGVKYKYESEKNRFYECDSEREGEAVAAAFDSRKSWNGEPRI
jgi:hypothetical protein